jgi:radical SAM-linked protein
MVVEKIRLRFRKDAALRLVSHHDLMRCFERLLRRAALPFHSSEGFHPKPRIVFALSLPLGIVGCEEVVELGLDEPMDPEEVRQRINREAPPGLQMLSAARVSPRLTAQVCRAGYRIVIDAARAAVAAGNVSSMLAAAELWIERTRPEHRRINIRPYLEDIRVSPALLEIDIRVTPNGTARPDEVLRALGVGDLLDEGNIIERCRLQLADECPTSENTAPEPALAASTSA